MPGNASFQFNSKYVIALAVGLVLGIGLWSWWSSDSLERPAVRAERAPATQSQDLELVEFAVRRARSWRATMSGLSDGQRFDTTQEVFCPYESHTVTMTGTGSAQAKVAQETIVNEGRVYTHQGTDAWSSEPADVKNQCEAGPIAGPNLLLPVLERLRPTTYVTKGSTVAFQGKSCRIWQLFSAESGNAIGTLCVEEFTHLPLEFRMGQVRVEYSNWNEPISIEPPQIPDHEQTPSAVP